MKYKQPLVVAAAIAALSLTFALLGHPAPSLPIPAPNWENSIAKAIAKGASLHQDVLLFFANAPASSSDHPFIEPTKAPCILCRVNPPDLVARPEDTAVTIWAQCLNVLQTPQVILLDPDGRPCARRIFAAEREFDLTSIQSLQAVKFERDRDFALARQSQDVPRARALDAALATVGDFAPLAYLPEMRQIIALDPQNTQHLREKYLATIAAADLDTAIQRDAYPLVDRADYQGAIAVLDRLLPDLAEKAGKRDLILAFKAQLLFSMGDRAAAAKTFDEALSCSTPATASQIIGAKQKVLAIQ